MPAVAATVMGVISCRTAPPVASQAAYRPASEQSISPKLKELYMRCSAAPRRSAAQQALVREMAERASNGKELLLTMRASVGVFANESDTEKQPAEVELNSLVAAKMARLADLDQLVEYASQYTVNPADSRAVAQRMLELAGNSADSRTWSRIRRAASHLNLNDVAQQAQGRVEALKSPQPGEAR